MVATVELRLCVESGRDFHWHFDRDAIQQRWGELPLTDGFNRGTFEIRVRRTDGSYILNISVNSDNRIHRHDASDAAGPETLRISRINARQSEWHKNLAAHRTGGYGTTFFQGRLLPRFRSRARLLVPFRSIGGRLRIRRRARS